MIGPLLCAVIIPAVGRMLNRRWWDQDWTRDLARLLRLPAKTCIMSPDGMTDMRRFKEVAGDRTSISNADVKRVSSVVVNSIADKASHKERE